MLEHSCAERTHSSAGGIDTSPLQSGNASETFLYQSREEYAPLLQQHKAKHIHAAW